MRRLSRQRFLPRAAEVYHSDGFINSEGNGAPFASVFGTVRDDPHDLTDENTFFPFL